MKIQYTTKKGSQRTPYHIGIADGLHFVKWKQGCAVVHRRVEVVEHVHHIDGFHLGADIGEAFHIGEEDGHFIERLRMHRLP